MINLSIYGGAFRMPEKTTIAPVTLHIENKNTSAINPAVLSSRHRQIIRHHEHPFEKKGVLLGDVRTPCEENKSLI